MQKNLLLFLPLLLAMLACGEQKMTQTATEAEKAMAEADYVDRTYLLEVDQLEKMMAEKENVVLIEVSKAADYAKGHLPGARNIWRPDYGNEEDYTYGGMRARRDQAEALLSRLGVEPTDFLVIYDTKGDVDAARFMWLLRRYGHEQMALLNGGKHAWEDAGLDLVTDAPEITPSTYSFGDKPEWLEQSAEREEVLAALEDPNVVLLDTRTLEEHTGQMLKNGAAKAGRIPNSVHIDWADAVNFDADFKFKSVEALRKLYESKGVTPDKKIIAYCHTGVRSAHTTFVLTQLLGYPNVVNYDGSWTEWSHYDELPFEIDPQLDRTPAVQ
jgi:thiosulfate/3-mercaptopyruvate sulfurtransferase